MRIHTHRHTQIRTWTHTCTWYTCTHILTNRSTDTCVHMYPKPHTLVHICMAILKFICKHMWAYKLAHTGTHTCTHQSRLTHTCTCTSSHICVHISTRTLIYMLVHSHAHSYTYPYIQTQSCICMHMYTHAFMYMYILYVCKHMYICRQYISRHLCTCMCTPCGSCSWQSSVMISSGNWKPEHCYSCSPWLVANPALSCRRFWSWFTHFLAPWLKQMWHFSFHSWAFWRLLSNGVIFLYERCHAQTMCLTDVCRVFLTCRHWGQKWQFPFKMKQPYSRLLTSLAGGHAGPSYS